jgi:hypothetical protein
VTGLPEVPSRNPIRQPHERRAEVNPFIDRIKDELQFIILFGHNGDTIGTLKIEKGGELYQQIVKDADYENTNGSKEMENLKKQFSEL